MHLDNGATVDVTGIDGDTVLRYLAADQPDGQQWATPVDPEMDTALIGWLNVDQDRVVAVTWKVTGVRPTPKNSENRARSSVIDDQYHRLRTLMPMSVLILSDDPVTERILELLETHPSMPIADAAGRALDEVTGADTETDDDLDG